MPEKSETAPETAPVFTSPNASRAAGIEEGKKVEAQRRSEIENLAEPFKHIPAAVDLARAAKDEGYSAEQFKTELLAAIAGQPAEPSQAAVPQQTQVSRSIVGGRTSRERMYEGITEAMDIAAGNIEPRKAAELARQNEYTGLSLVELSRMCLEADGFSTRGMSPLDVAGAVLSRYIEPGTANLTTANFPSVLEDVINKALFRGFDEAPVSWSQFCGTDSAADFKPGTRPGLSHFTSLAVVAENAQIQDGIVNDKKEAFQIQTYARKFSVTRQTLVNDDLASLASIAARMGNAAGRTVDEQVYAFIEANGNMTEDGNPLFFNRTAPNDNLLAGAPSTATISAARVAMGKMEDTNGVVLGIVPQYMVVPLELEEEMLVLRTTSVDPDAANVTRNNVYQQLWTPVSTPRLTDANDWYMFGARGEHINVVFLNGMQSPMMARDEGWSVLAAHWRVVLDFTVMAVDYRAAIKFANI